MKIQQILENQNYPLYHGSKIINISRIIRDGAIRSGLEIRRTTGLFAVSTSRSYKIAANFSGQDDDFEIPGGGVFILDRARIRQKYRIIPFQDIYSGTGRGPGEYSESEELIMTKELPLSYSRCLVLSDKTLSWYDENRNSENREYSHMIMPTQRQLDLIRNYPGRISSI